MLTSKTIRDLDYPASRIYPAFTLPTGTAVTLIEDGGGTRGHLWAVSNPQVIMDLTGNTHDPIYRYFWIEPKDVEPIKVAQPAPLEPMPETLASRVATYIKAYLDALNDEEQDGGPISPNGDDFNDLVSAIGAILAGAELAAPKLTHNGR